MSGSKRTEMLARALTLFSEHGFSGASLAQIASALGVTKQAVLHHFGTKERLYGAVLAEVSEALDQLVEACGVDGSKGTYRLAAVMRSLADPDRLEATRLLMRELLDNPDRAKTADHWYLKGFLGRLILDVQAHPMWQETETMEALALVYQLLGMVNYYAISGPTLTGIYGDGHVRDLDDFFAQQFECSIKTLLAAGPPSRQ